MARSLEATETFRLQVIEQNSAHNTSTIKVPGYLEVTRKYTGGTDSNRGQWMQLVPGLFYQRHANRTTASKGGRALNLQFDGVDVLNVYPTSLARIDFKN